ncbi:hypothetical protein C2845_PM13G11100 [Panicum miliaceum]|uniref:Uncharacterized protein n=1 Tax=Panicum miliaceum TaxID=4540 RepID=A0A3L6RHG8_PANMI|nr:hypothetical protein C2845_PM13G11100 [Panicum miliaceum]
MMQRRGRPGLMRGGRGGGRFASGRSREDWREPDGGYGQRASAESEEDERRRRGDVRHADGRQLERDWVPFRGAGGGFRSGRNWPRTSHGGPRRPEFGGPRNQISGWRAKQEQNRGQGVLTMEKNMEKGKAQQKPGFDEGTSDTVMEDVDQEEGKEEEMQKFGATCSRCSKKGESTSFIRGGIFSIFEGTAEAIIDIAVSRELDVLVEKIMAKNIEEVGELQMTIEEKNISDQLGLEAAARDSNKEVLQGEVEEPVVQLEEVSNSEETHMGVTLIAAAKKIGSVGSARALTRTALEGQGVNPAVGELIAAAAIPEALVSPTRASSRLARSSDKHILTRVERRTAEKNLESAASNSSNDPVGSLLLNAVVLNIKRLGIAPGSCEDEMSITFVNINACHKLSNKRF